MKEKVCYILVVHYPRQLGIMLPFAGYTFFKVLLRLRFHRTNTAPNRKGKEGGGGGDSAGMVGGTIDRLVDGKTV